MSYTVKIPNAWGKFSVQVNCTDGSDAMVSHKDNVPITCVTDLLTYISQDIGYQQQTNGTVWVDLYQMVPLP